MAVKTFAVGEVLTASDTNTYLNNGGLVYVYSEAIGSTPVASFTPASNVFSSTYDNYRIIWQGGTCSSGGVSSRIIFGSTNIGYYGSQPYWTAAGGSGANPINNGAFLYCGSQDTGGWGLTLDVLGPYTATYTQISGFSSGGTAVTINMGYLANTTSYTKFTISAGAGTFTGGTVTVYGYRKA